jgi:hypothetical protein
MLVLTTFFNFIENIISEFVISKRSSRSIMCESGSLEGLSVRAKATHGNGKDFQLNAEWAFNKNKEIR